MCCGPGCPIPTYYSGGLAPVGGKIYLFLGDSEASGSDDNVPADYPPGYSADTMLLWRKLVDSAGNAGPWGRYKEVVAPAQMQLGPSGFFAYYMSVARGNERVGIVQTARGGYIAEQWLPTAPAAATAYAKIVQHTNAALLESGPGATFAGAILIDGANDAAQNKTTWRTSWNTTWAALQTDIVGNGTAQQSAAGKPLFHAILTTSYPDVGYSSNASWDAQRARQLAFTADGPNRYAYQANDAGGYNPGWFAIHKTCAGQAILAQELSVIVAGVVP